jgi:glucan phosphoethanolaminetransferase (alkaline phosphatase superfamily)
MLNNLYEKFSESFSLLFAFPVSAAFVFVILVIALIAFLPRSFHHERVGFIAFAVLAAGVIFTLIHGVLTNSIAQHLGLAASDAGRLWVAVLALALVGLGIVCIIASLGLRRRDRRQPIVWILAFYVCVGVIVSAVALSAGGHT